ncbi:hypothetical protein P154DRAFT_552419 [Amniculicola lignicola CBS 123094]|uniref:Aminoglycoside phosphotransferase domain-containing protein n=1 Tax=Amniculicola lignicola CBS 123094 TaxID=1392246 RepID=A0A6A5WP95_9PLEO|nr:hypothetical protein P154DRAFT_552419 [Amniculicola lignicola CBS 123094]
MGTPQQKGLMPEAEANDAIVLHEIPGCLVIRYPDSTVVKKGRRVTLYEGRALELAAQLKLPVLHLHEAQKEGEDGEGLIRMDFIHGERLNLVWGNMAMEEKDSICQQLQRVLIAMRSVPWETGFIRSCSGGPARDCRQYTDYSNGPYKDEATFNMSFYFDLVKTTPESICSALSKQLCNNHRIVFSHNGQVTGLLDWEYAGWYPEHWDYIKFFERPCKYRDWKDHASLIFPQVYESELAYH